MGGLFFGKKSQRGVCTSDGGFRGMKGVSESGWIDLSEHFK